MKEPENGVDKDKFNAFVEKVFALAEETFGTDEGGDLPVTIDIHDRTRFRVGPPLVISHHFLRESDMEWMEAIRTVSSHSSEVSDALRSETQCFHYEISERHEMDKISTLVRVLGKELGIEMDLGTCFGSRPEGTRWMTKRRGGEEGLPVALQYRNLFSVHEDLSAFIKESIEYFNRIEGWECLKVRVKHDSGISSFTVYGLMKRS